MMLCRPMPVYGSRFEYKNIMADWRDSRSSRIRRYSAFVVVLLPATTEFASYRKSFALYYKARQGKSKQQAILRLVKNII